MTEKMMKAVIIDQYGGPEELRVAQVPIPQPKTGEVLIRVGAAALNPADWKWREGWFHEHIPVRFPHILGYDVAGSVVAGDGFVAGARVAATLEHNKGGGGYAQYAVAKSRDVALLSPDMDFAQAAAILTPALTGAQMIEKVLNVQSGYTVLITGATGAVGRFAVYAAKRRGARVVAAVRNVHRQTARDMGADDILTLGEDQWKGAPFDAIADTVGGEAVAVICRKLAKNGRIATVSTTPINPECLSVQPIFVSVHGDGQRLAQLITWVKRDEVTLPVTMTLKPEEIASGHRLLEQGGMNGKIIIRF